MIKHLRLLFAVPILMTAIGANALRSPFDNAQATLYGEATNFFNSKNYDAAIRYYNDFLEYVPSELEPGDERIRMAHQNIALASYLLRRSDAYRLLSSYKTEFPYTQNASQIELYLATLDFENGKYKPALKRLEAIDTDGLTEEEITQLTYYKGYCYLVTKKKDKAQEQFDMVLRRGANKYQTPAHYYYGYCKFGDKEYGTALEHLLKVKGVKEFSNTTPYLICQCYYQLGDCNRASAMGDSIIRSNAKSKYNADIKHLSASCKYRNGDYAGALADILEYQKAKRKFKREDWYLAGMSYYYTDNAAKAVECLSKVTNKKDSLTTNAYFHIGQAYLKLGDKKNARLAFERSEGEDALYNYALVTYEMSYSPFNESVSAFERFLKEYPDSKYRTKVYEYLVNVYLTTKNYTAAYKSIQNIGEKTPEIMAAEQRVLFGLGTTQIANRRYSDASKNFSTILAGKSYNDTITSRSHFWYGECLYRMGKYDDAITEFNTYLKTCKSVNEEEYGYALYNLGYANLKKGDKAESNKWFGKFTALEVTDKQMLTDAYNRIGDNYFIERGFSGAKAAYGKAMNVADKVKGADYALYQIGLISGLEKNYTDKIATLESLLQKYPKSEWTDDARFEIGKSYIALSENDKAIDEFKKITITYPKTNPIVVKSKLQIAMLLYNKGDVNGAIAMYKEVATQYPDTEEAETSMQTLESIMVDNNRVKEYADIAKSLNKGTGITIKEDSLTYKAAEKIYFRNDFAGATPVFEAYIKSYPKGKYRSISKYYLANCYYQTGNKAKATDAYKSIVSSTENPNKKLTLERLSALCYESGDLESTIKYSDDLLAVASDAEVIADAKYRRMKSNIGLGKEDLADIKDLATDTRNAYGAEAEYLYIKHLYDTKDYAGCEKEFFKFVDSGTQHSYFLAEAFIVLADCYMAQEKYFDAKQYLLSLKENYNPAPDDISTAIDSRLLQISDKETEQVAPVEEDTLTENKEYDEI